MKKVIFFEIKEASLKTKKILEISLYHLERKEPLLFVAADDLSLKFVDDLLWKTPFDSWIPHSIDHFSKKSPIVLTKTPDLHPSFLYVFNLRSIPYEKEGEILYEFDDFTSPAKQEISQKKFKSYHERKIPIESRY